jgi:hypothetical protein
MELETVGRVYLNVYVPRLEREAGAAKSPAPSPRNGRVAVPGSFRDGSGYRHGSRNMTNIEVGSNPIAAEA